MTDTPPQDDPPQTDDGKLPLLPKHKKFLVPIIFLLAVMVVGSVAGVLIGFSSIKSSDAFKATLATLEADPAVKQHVGLPIEAGTIVIGKHDKNNGTYDLTFTITGPVGKAAVRSRCEQFVDDEPWEVTYLDIGVGGREGTVHTLVGDPDDLPGGRP